MTKQDLIEHLGKSGSREQRKARKDARAKMGLALRMRRINRNLTRPEFCNFVNKVGNPLTLLTLTRYETGDIPYKEKDLLFFSEMFGITLENFLLEASEMDLNTKNPVLRAASSITKKYPKEPITDENISIDGSALREQRQKANLSQAELAILADMSQSYVSRFETGDQKITKDLLERILSALEIDINVLLTKPENENKKENMSTTKITLEDALRRKSRHAKGSSQITSNRKKIGEVFCTKRLSKNYSQREMAENISEILGNTIEKEIISSFERGLSPFTLAILEAYGTVFQVSVDSLLEEASNVVLTTTRKRLVDVKKTPDSEEEPKTVGDLIASHRRKLKLTQEELGKEAGVTGKHISKFELGTGKIPATTLKAIAKVLKVPFARFTEIDSKQEVSWILAQEEEPKPRKKRQSVVKGIASQTFRSRLKERREELNLTRAEVSKKAKIAETSIARYEHDLFERISLATLHDFATALECSIDYLIGLQDEPHAETTTTEVEVEVVKDYQVEDNILQMFKELEGSPVETRFKLYQAYQEIIGEALPKKKGFLRGLFN